MKTLAYLSLSILLTASPVTGLSAECPKDCSKPDKLGDEVKEKDAHFAYKSDVEKKPDGKIILNHCVHNKDDSPLVFSWKKVDFVRPPWNPLPPDEIQQDPHPIVGYRDTPDTDAPIFYTQSKKKRSAAIYVEDDEKKKAVEGTLSSSFLTAFYDVNKKIRKLYIQITSVFKDGIISQEIIREPNNITIGLGGIDKQALNRLDQFQSVSRQIAFHGDKLEVLLFSEVIPKKQADWFPATMRKKQMFFIRPSPIGRKAVKFSILRTQSVKQIAATLAVLDEKGSLIATGRCALFVPNYR